jgi:hypothetical protein
MSRALASGNPNVLKAGGFITWQYSLAEGSGGSAKWEPAFGTDRGNNLDSTASPFKENGYSLKGNVGVDAGGNDLYPKTAPEIDVAGKVRIQVGTIDMGAYESGDAVPDDPKPDDPKPDDPKPDDPKPDDPTKVTLTVVQENRTSQKTLTIDGVKIEVDTATLQKAPKSTVTYTLSSTITTPPGMGATVWLTTSGVDGPKTDTATGGSFEMPETGATLHVNWWTTIAPEGVGD